ncbi:M67 family metallopeptidase [Magnetospirillum sp. SS-4]|uniref:M67 family metallopeptidase n=1 Tax=Magnetospirillum sp. SS-4 TaxID=2681465 RepID=UPI0013831254|nr:M67 family metallopeptidase [Magnetospirillum sp. SS-4]CAA7622315.1 Mov34/MPN/PAD-1 [Magnetospirillum sp. SS-4]
MIRLSAGDMAVIADAAEAAFPFECCGLLVGRGQRVIEVTRLVPAPNLLAGCAPDRFELDPRVRFATERALRGTAERLVGHWHSHPNGSPLPSPTDLEQAWEPEMIWLIAAVAPLPDGRPQTIQILAHRLDREGRRVRPVTIHQTDRSRSG